MDRISKVVLLYLVKRGKNHELAERRRQNRRKEIFVNVQIRKLFMYTENSMYIDAHSLYFGLFSFPFLDNQRVRKLNVQDYMEYVRRNEIFLLS